MFQDESGLLRRDMMTLVDYHESIGQGEIEITRLDSCRKCLQRHDVEYSGKTVMPTSKHSRHLPAPSFFRLHCRDGLDFHELSYLLGPLVQKVSGWDDHKGTLLALHRGGQGDISLPETCRTGQYPDIRLENLLKCLLLPGPEILQPPSQEIAGADPMILNHIVDSNSLEDSLQGMKQSPWELQHSFVLLIQWYSGGDIPGMSIIANQGLVVFRIGYRRHSPECLLRLRGQHVLVEADSTRKVEHHPIGEVLSFESWNSPDPSGIHLLIARHRRD